MKRIIALEASRTLALYSFAGWVYIALVALVHPQTLGLQLTHFASFPHEDTFGEICFVISLVSFFIYSVLRHADRPADSLDILYEDRGGNGVELDASPGCRLGNGPVLGKVWYVLGSVPGSKTTSPVLS